MKLSIAWIFDHIDANWKKVDIFQLVDTFNQTTAEIEGCKKISIDLDQFTLVNITSIEKDSIIVESPEWKKTFELPLRYDAKISSVAESNQYLIKKINKKECTWATLIDFHCNNKEGLLPAVWVEKDLQAGRWKEFFETDDYILDIDNKSITHRPDLWGHRGVAREVAALLNLPFKPIKDFIVNKTIKQYEKQAPSISVHPYAVKVENPVLCKRFAGLYFDHIESRPSLLWMASRLARVDSRPIDTIVDSTNYVMLDISQPMHAFDAHKIPSKQIVVRLAKNKEKLTLLDDQTIELTSRDLVVTDGKKPIALAGVMGGKESAVSDKTKTIFLESANFNPASVRKTTEQFKTRTDASARFEKSLDPNQNTTGLLRFLKLLKDAQLPMHACDEIVSIGKRIEPIVVRVTQEYIENRLGISLATDFISKTLEKIGFIVKKEHNTFIITVPTYRATKDIGIKADIVEEVGRFYGLSSIEPKFACKKMEPFNIQWVQRLREIKQCMAFTMQMHEIYSYAFFDETFLQELNWQPTNTLSVKSPISQNYQQLITTLVPNLLKAVANNAADYDQLRFFEWARIWQKNNKAEEEKSLAGIFYNQKEDLDFYEVKSLLMCLFEMLSISVSWQKVEKPQQPWYAPFQTAYIMHEGTKIGIAGKAHKGFLHRVVAGDAFIVELDGNFFLNYKKPVKHHMPSSKFPTAERDVSMLIPMRVMVQELVETIVSVDKKISKVTLIDFFEKPEWPDQRSVTLRFVISHPEKTLTKEEVDIVWDNVAKKLKKHGATIR